MPMNVIEVPISKIKVGKLFREDLGDLEILAQTIQDKGVLQPLTLDTRYNLIFGRRRLEGAKLAGLKTVPCIIRTSKTEIDRREVELIENVARKDMTWQERVGLQKRIFDLKKAQDPNWSRQRQADLVDTSKASVVRQMEIAEALDVLPGLAEYKTEEQAYRALKKIEETVAIEALVKKTKGKGMEKAKWAADHYIIKDVITGLRSCQPGSADFAEVDPPYAISLNERKARSTRGNTQAYREIKAEEYPKFLSVLAKEVFRVQRNNSFSIWWHAPSWYQILIETLQETGYSVSDIPAIWNKGTSGQIASPDTTLGSSYEQFLVARKGQPRLHKPGRSNVFDDFSPLSGAKKIHPTEKPVELYMELLATFCYPNFSIVVPFLGSGNTLRAAYKSDMTGWGYDLDDLTKKQFVARVKSDLMQEQEKEEKK